MHFFSCSVSSFGAFFIVARKHNIVAILLSLLQSSMQNMAFAHNVIKHISVIGLFSILQNCLKDSLCIRVFLSCYMVVLFVCVRFIFAIWFGDFATFEQKFGLNCSTIGMNEAAKRDYSIFHCCAHQRRIIQKKNKQFIQKDRE